MIVSVKFVGQKILTTPLVNCSFRRSLHKLRNIPQCKNGNNKKLLKTCSNNQTSSNYIHMSKCYQGMEEFFDKEENWENTTLMTGAPWSKSLLRIKSTEDLQKIWYVLLKERNMLLTMEHYYLDNDYPMPAPDRLEKVAESMSNLRDVLDEREYAQNMLLYGRKEKIGGEWRINDLGFVYWYQYKEHLLPKEFNKDYEGDQPSDIRLFSPLLTEWHLRLYEKGAKNKTIHFRKLKSKWKKIRENNQHLPENPPEWWLKKMRTKFRYGIHPETEVIS